MAPPSDTPMVPVEERRRSTRCLTVEESDESLGSAMAKGAALMKEEDADFLQRGVKDSCSSGRTPLLAPISPIAREDVPPFSLSDTSITLPTLSKVIEDSSPADSSKLSSSEILIRVKPRPEAAGGEANRTFKIGKGALAGEADRRERRNMHLRRCLSGDVVLPRSDVETMSAVTILDHQTISSSPVSVADDVRPSNPNDATEAVNTSDLPENSRLHRSKSFDRRLQEAAQFAEAVGERPPLNQDEVQDIIEEIESDYDDSDSEVEFHVDHASMPPDEASITSMRRLSCNNTSFSGAEGNAIDDKPVQEIHIEEQNVVAMTPQHHRRAKSRPHWPFSMGNQFYDTKLHRLPPMDTQTFVYKGICSNPPEITKRGISRGNYAQLHRKAWLEVSDKYHRYGKNLRLYYRRWESLGFPTNQFFDWLDSKGEAAGQPLPIVEECPRAQLDSDTVHYINNPEVTEGYALSIETNDKGKGVFLTVDREIVQTGADGWIFVLRDNVLYGAEKITSVSNHSKQRFHHSSFFGGKAVAAAGIIITNEEGILTRLYPHSGHYRPGEADMQRLLFHLQDKGVDLRSFDIDTQQIFHLARPEEKGPAKEGATDKKKKKTQSLHLKPAVYVACFLAHKARFIGLGIFDQIHTIRKAHVTSVAEALEECDAGGFWAKVRREYEDGQKLRSPR